MYILKTKKYENSYIKKIKFKKQKSASYCSLMSVYLYYFLYIFITLFITTYISIYINIYM